VLVRGLAAGRASAGLAVAFAGTSFDAKAGKKALNPGRYPRCSSRADAAGIRSTARTASLRS